jgi:hypothetical protein
MAIIYIVQLLFLRVPANVVKDIIWYEAFRIHNEYTAIILYVFHTRLLLGTPVFFLLKTHYKFVLRESIESI